MFGTSEGLGRADMFGPCYVNGPCYGRPVLCSARAMARAMWTARDG